MNEIVNKFLLTGDKFMPKLHLRQPGFMYSTCESFTQNKERIQKLQDFMRFMIYLSKLTRQRLFST